MFCAKCQAPLLGGSVLCSTCGFDNGLGIGPPGRAVGRTHAPHTDTPHDHSLELGSIAPLSAKTNWGARIAGLATVLVVFGIGGYGWWSTRWAAAARRPVWASPPVAAPGLPTAGLDFTCVLTQERAILCWGNNDIAQLGDTAPVRRGDPSALVAPGPFTQLDAGDSHACALRPDGQVICWGSDARGQLGVEVLTECVTSRGRLACSALPQVVPTPPAMQITSGAEHSCALAADSTVNCWGSNFRGQLGVDRLGSGTTVSYLGPYFRFTTLTAGGFHTCGLRADGSAICWGGNASGELGTTARREWCRPTATTRAPCVWVPAPAATNLRFASLTAGGGHTCGVDTQGKAWCWGANIKGQLGSGAASDSTSVPVAVAGSARYQYLSAGFAFTCGLTTERTVWCWGDASVGQLGSADTTFNAMPALVTLPDSVRSLGVGAYHACVVTVAQRVYCWGAGTEGQLASGRLANSRLPREAGMPANRAGAK